MNLKRLILTNNNCYKAGRVIKPRGIMVHSTGANNPNLSRYVGPDDGFLGPNRYNNHWNQPTPDGRQVCVHAFIGRIASGSIATYQTLPWDRRGWHCGSGKKGTANDTHISFELCEDALTDRAYLGAVYTEAVELCVHLCDLYGLDPMGDGVIIDHAEGYKRGIASNHGDVGYWLKKHSKSMDSFRADVARLMTQEEEQMTQDQFNAMMGEYLKVQSAKPVSGWAREGWDKAVKSGLLDGTAPGSAMTREQVAVVLDRLGLTQ